MNNNKPLKCCYPDCFHCIYTDCRYDKLEYFDIKLQDKFDKELEAVSREVRSRRVRQARYFRTEKGKITQRKYSQSEKGKITQKKYSKSEKYKESQNRYLQSDKGKEMKKKKSKIKIESGKNAEYCRTYYQRHKEELREKAREKYRKKHKVN